jgi:dienelactone hydrolase
MAHLGRGLLPAALLSATTTVFCVSVPQEPPFTRSSFTVAEFDPSTGKVPFPMLTPCPVAVDPTTGACPSGGTYDTARGRVALPIVHCIGDDIPRGCDTGLSVQLKMGLNTLDGFSTYGGHRVTVSGPLDAATVHKGTAFLLDLSSGLPAAFTPRVVTSRAGDEDQILIALDPERAETFHLPAPLAPLRPETTYLGLVTTGVRDAAGRALEPDALFALLRARDPLAASDGSILPGSMLANRTPESLGCQGTEVEKQACAQGVRASLEASRRGLDLFFAQLEARAQPLPREEIALLWTVRTQSTAATLVDLRASLIGQVPAVMTRVPQMTSPGEAYYPPGTDVRVSQFVNGCVLTPLLLRKPTEAFPAKDEPLVFQPVFVPYVLALPQGPRPAAGWPVVLFGHGLRRWRYQMIAIANRLAAAGFATIAIDHPWHGDRTNLRLGGRDASGNPVAGTEVTDPSHCSPRPFDSPEAEGIGSQCPAGVAVNADGSCASGSKIVSGARMLNPLNLFATRDNFRQAVVDLMQLAFTLRTRTVARDGVAFDPGRTYYLGTSLGGLIGTLLLATEPAIDVGVLSVAGGGLSHIVTESTDRELCGPVFEGLGLLGLCERRVSLNPCACDDTLAYRQFLHLVQWILDPADPINYASHLVEDPLWCMAGGLVAPCRVQNGRPLAKRVLFQMMVGDEVIANQTTLDLRAAAGPSTCFSSFTGGGHRFLTDTSETANAALREQGQNQVVRFFESRGLCPQ